MSQTVTFADTMKRVKSELKKDGKTKVDIAEEAAGSDSIAVALLQAAAKEIKVEVDTRVNKKTVSAKVKSD